MRRGMRICIRIATHSWRGVRLQKMLTAMMVQAVRIELGISAVLSSQSSFLLGTTDLHALLSSREVSQCVGDK
jgi:hypothetical protein